MWLQSYDHEKLQKLMKEGLGYNEFYNKITNKFMLIQVEWAYKRSKSLIIVKS